MKRVVLCRPMGPRNLGTVLRVAANFGPVEVGVVAPARPSLFVHPELRQMSHGVEEIAGRVLCFDTLSAALADCSLSIGFSARPRDHRITRPWPELQPRASAEDAAGERVALVFGNEESGLSREETAHLMCLAHIATTSVHTSLNLGMAVGIVLHSLFVGRTPRAFGRLGAPIRGHDRAYLIAHLKDGLGTAAGSDLARADLEASIERVFAHAEVETRDARAWHMLLRAMGNLKTPPDYGIAPVAKPGAVEGAASNGEASLAVPPGETSATPSAQATEGSETHRP